MMTNPWIKSLKKCMNCKTGRSRRDTFMFQRSVGTDTYFICPVCDMP